MGWMEMENLLNGFMSKGIPSPSINTNDELPQVPILTSFLKNSACGLSLISSWCRGFFSFNRRSVSLVLVIEVLCAYLVKSSLPTLTQCIRASLAQTLDIDFKKTKTHKWRKIFTPTSWSYIRYSCSQGLTDQWTGREGSRLTQGGRSYSIHQSPGEGREPSISESPKLRDLVALASAWALKTKDPVRKAIIGLVSPLDGEIFFPLFLMSFAFSIL